MYRKGTGLKKGEGWWEGRGKKGRGRGKQKEREEGGILAYLPEKLKERDFHNPSTDVLLARPGPRSSESDAGTV